MNNPKRLFFLVVCFLVIILPLFAQNGNGDTAAAAIGKGVIIAIFLVIFRAIVGAIKNSKSKNKFTKED